MIENYKKTYLILIFCVLSIGVMAERKLSVRLQNEHLSVGEVGSLIVQYEGSETPQLKAFPNVPGILWDKMNSNVSQSMYIENNRRKVLTKVTLSFVAKKAGKWTIPPIAFYVNNKKMVSTSLNLNVAKAAEVPLKLKQNLKKKKKDIKDYLYVYCHVLSDRKLFYTGEEVPVEIGLYALEQLRFEFTYPTLSGDVLLHDYSKINNNANFLPYTSSSREINGYSFKFYKTFTYIRLLKSGKIKLNATISGNANIQQRGGWGWQTIPAKIESKPVELTFENLPSYTGSGMELGLIGDWNVSYSLSKSNLKVGEMVSLKITARGTGALDNLRVKELKLPGFRSFPAEVKKNHSSNKGENYVTLEYILIPTKSGNQQLKCTVATFSPTKGEYVEKTFDRTFDIKPGEQSSAINTVSTSGRPDEIKPKSSHKKENVRTNIFYLKHSPYGFITLPLLENSLWSAVMLVALGIILIIISFFYSKQKKRFENDPLSKRRYAALKSKKELLKQIENSDENTLEELIQTKVVPYLNDITGMPPGTSALELIEHLNDEELKKCLQSVGHSNFMPGTSRYSGSEIKQQLLNALKTMTLLALFLIPGSMSGADNFAKGEKAYNNGKFEKAIIAYKSDLRKNMADPYVLYNLGNCYFQKEEYGNALLYFTRAYRLAPTDSTIVENLNFVRRKLFLKEIGKVDKLRDFFTNMRDNLRPDQWLLVIATLLFIISIAVAMRIQGKQKYTMVIITLSTLFSLIAVIAIMTQYNSTYNPQTGVVVQNKTALYQLPSENNIDPTTHLKEGIELIVKESRQGWLHIIGDGIDGWVKQGSVIRYSDYNNNSKESHK